MKFLKKKTSLKKEKNTRQVHKIQVLSSIPLFLFLFFSFMFSSLLPPLSLVFSRSLSLLSLSLFYTRSPAIFPPPFLLSVCLSIIYINKYYTCIRINEAHSMVNSAWIYDTKRLRSPANLRNFHALVAPLRRSGKPPRIFITKKIF